MGDRSRTVDCGLRRGVIGLMHSSHCQGPIGSSQTDRNKETNHED